jgi:hypothetical protein
MLLPLIYLKMLSLEKRCLKRGNQLEIFKKNKKKAESKENYFQSFFCVKISKN